MVLNKTGLENMTSEWDNITASTSEDPPSDFPLELLTQFGLYNAGNALLNSMHIVCSVIGLPSNLASILTLLKMKPMTSSIFLLTLMAVVDFSVVFIRQLFAILISAEEVLLTDGGCKVYFYTASTLGHFSIWLMLSLTVERFIAVWFPLKVSNICTLRRTQVTCVMICLALLLFNIIYPLGAYEYQIPGGFRRCGFHPDYWEVMMTYSWIDAAIFFFIPWPVLLFCNIMIIIGLRMSIRKKEQLTNKPGQSTETKRQQRSITIMLVLASLTCFVLLTPVSVFFIYEKYWDFNADIYNYVSYVFVNSLTYFLSDLNNAINFWLYVISGRRFRKAFIALITCRNTEDALRSKASSATAVSAIASTTNINKGIENGGFNKTDENSL